LKVASVIGVEFSKNLLGAILPFQLAKEQLNRQLLVLQDLSFVKEMESEKGFMCFSLNTMQEALYNLMLFSQRRALHKSIALYYQQSEKPSLGVLAHHWLNTLDEGVSCCMLALLKGF
jgi:predicted ATPase